jgi:DNA-binding CsgD family transcriptional regulator
MHMIVSHIKRASRGRDFFGRDMVLSRLVGSVMAGADFGLILASVDRGIIYANNQADALMRARNGVRCDRNSITAKGFTSSRDLQSLVATASRQQDESAKGGTLILRDADGALSLAVHVVPLCRNFAQDPSYKDQPAAGFIIVDCQQALSERISDFADLFALTAGEARVASQLVSGEGLRKAASYLNIALSTARSHLRHIFEKTGTHSQAELVKVFCQVTLPRPGHARAEDASGKAAASRFRPEVAA